MKNTIKTFGIIAFTVVIGFSMAGCLSYPIGPISSGMGGGGGASAANARDDGVAKTLVINNIDGLYGGVLVTLSSSSTPASSMVAVGAATISGTGISIPLVIPGREDTRWTGTGDYYVVLVFEDYDNAIYFYSAGGRSALRYSITDATTTIALDQFLRY